MVFPGTMIVNIEKTAKEQRNGEGCACSPALRPPRNPTPNAGAGSPGLSIHASRAGRF